MPWKQKLNWCWNKLKNYWNKWSPCRAYSHLPTLLTKHQCSVKKLITSSNANQTNDPINQFSPHAWSKKEMKDLMEKCYDKEIDLYCKYITSHYYCKASPCILPLDHENLQKFMLFVFHDKDSATATPLAPYWKVIQYNPANNAHDNFQMRHQLPHLRY